MSLHDGDNLNSLLRGLPIGDPQYVRDHENGAWNVCIFKPGTVESLATVATNMDKGAACWLMNKLKAAFQEMGNEGV